MRQTVVECTLPCLSSPAGLLFPPKKMARLQPSPVGVGFQTFSNPATRQGFHFLSASILRKARVSFPRWNAIGQLLSDYETTC